MPDLQDLVDRLAANLSRPVGVDDRRLHSIAYSAHVDEIDRVRLASILQREPPREVSDWLAQMGISRAQTFVRLPANPSLGMAARVCVPLRFDERLLGFLWLIDEPIPLTGEELERTQTAAGELGLALLRQTAEQDQDRQEERRLLRTALGLTTGSAQAAVKDLVASGRLAATHSHAVLVIDVSEAPDDIARARIAAAVEHDRRFSGTGEFLMLVSDANVYALMACDGEHVLLERAMRITERIRRAHDAVGGRAPVAGLSAIGKGTDDLPLGRREAELAARVGTRLDEATQLSRWDQLGAFQILAPVVDVMDPAALIPKSFRALLADSDAVALVPTLSAFLDAGADARQAADQLYVHRSSLYHRLHRIERICDLNLSDGDARLELHLALRLWRLAGEPSVAQIDTAQTSIAANPFRAPEGSG